MQRRREQTKRRGHPRRFASLLKVTWRRLLRRPTAERDMRTTSDDSRYREVQPVVFVPTNKSASRWFSR